MLASAVGILMLVEAAATWPFGKPPVPLLLGRNGARLCPAHTTPLMLAGATMPFATCWLHNAPGINFCQTRYGPQFTCQSGPSELGQLVGVCCAPLGTTMNLPGCPAGYVSVPEARDQGSHAAVHFSERAKACSPSANGTDCPFECVKPNPAESLAELVCCMRQPA